MNDFGGVGGHGDPALLILLGDHLEDPLQLRQRFPSAGHQSVAAGQGGNLRHPASVVLAVDYDLIVREFHSYATRVARPASQAEFPDVAHQRPDVLDGGLGQNAVTQAEDVTGARPGALQQHHDARFQFGQGGEQRRRVQVPLDG